MNDTRPAGFWIRAVAFVIDLAVLGLVRHSLGLVARRVWGVSVQDSMTLTATTLAFTAVFAGLYVILLHAATGQTIGKLLVRVRVVQLDGEPVAAGASLLRCLGYGLSWATVGFGYLMAGLRHDKRALHDLIAGTRVERVPAREPAPIETPATMSPVA